MNKVYRSYLGQGYYGCIVPPVIKRNVIENPGWITQYTPYQAELAQGRLESLMNYQTMIVDLTGLDIANASLLDEGTAAAEAVTLSYRMFRGKRNKYFIDEGIHSNSLAVIKTRAKFLNIDIVTGSYQDFVLTDDVCGVMLQYPNNDGIINNYHDIIQQAKGLKIPVAMATDLLALTILKSPGELGASIAFGNSQRFGVPMGCGGPHAAFFAVKDELKKQMPGRLVGKSWDQYGVPTYRLALQTREQFIRREKATSNICTAQALLANVSAMYAVYHGPKGLKDIAMEVHKATVLLAEGLRLLGWTINNETVFDTIMISNGDISTDEIQRRCDEKKINIRHYGDGTYGVSLDETVIGSDLIDLLYVFGANEEEAASVLYSVSDADSNVSITGSGHERETPYLTHPVFNSYHSETKLLRYMKELENRDLSLCHSMIPLGSCTMKLNPTSALLPVSLPQFNTIHPYVPSNQTTGYQSLIDELESHLCSITGYDKFSFQPNSGAQGEYAGLCAILAYLRDKGEGQRDICLIPASAHGTNPASAIMAGLKVVEIPMNKEGEVTKDSFKQKIEEAGDKLATIMVTYPSTSGVFEDSIREVCDMVHYYGGQKCSVIYIPRHLLHLCGVFEDSIREVCDMVHYYGGQVYVDGANLNAQVGLCRPGDYGGDVSHLNLHKTFCIPHGGGGPGMGPIGVKAHLAPYLPGHPVTGPNPLKSFGTVSSAAWGSASIIPVSWAYILMMGSKGLKKASEIAIVNANYMAARLKGHYNILFRGTNGFNAHEFILDTRCFKNTSGIEAIDIAKRMQDYGFHAPTVSWPVSNTLMIEPTESEGKAELDRYCDALISIRQEISEVEEGKYDIKNNVLKNAPHPMYLVTASNWPFPYSREKAAFPAEWLNPYNKVWTGSARANDVHGDRNLVATHNQELKPLR
ncbi:PREDICTED: glycine dehydrogenase (decarboxylating), mitochondrial-like isoform X1 [Amphimedon queenslandica]|uniref:glycine dehydrogenase (aminomethyl-transferring) n=1 Tax=Amphimedon queenslandica TaxID=400682 RepID=A0AAN0J3P4_AMPQE|nr:PREDICTED: glycine dehydrogenase (decarboxylating), mitochondrial-like isoform X1 [Amphimedon queenslandica]|eukprot:XP_019851639.1 PREDICTED: glycine dehydrogenase (decarboxylating), mitochondrial-like isoform X1 [Amphimedon queenslandica]